MDDRFRLLSVGERTAEPRQQTLRSVVDWSYDLLFADEQRVLRRLSVFVGGFDLHAAEAVCAADDLAAADVVDILGHLVDKSLVSVVSLDGGARYRLLQTLVDYGRMRLAEFGEEADTADRHLQWMVDFAAAAEPGLHSHDQLRWTRRLGLELDNARAALQWALERGRTHQAVALAAGLAYGWYITGAVHEGQAFITRALSPEGEASLEHRAVALAWGGWLTQIGSGATSDAIEYTERAVTIARGASARSFAVAATVASLMRAYRAETVEATELIEEAATKLAASPDRWGQAYVDWVRSGLALKSGDADRTADLLRASIAAFREEGDDYGRAIASIRLGELAELRGDYDEAIEATRFAYDVIMSTGPGANVSILATRLGNLAALQGRFDDSASWHETALFRARQYGFPGPAVQAVSGMAVTAALRGHLDESETLHREALHGYESVGSVEGAAFSNACLGFLATRRGDTATAIALHRRSLSAAMLGNERRAMALAVAGLAVAHAADGNHRDAATLLGVTADLRGVGPTIAPWVLTEMEQVDAASRAALGDEAFCSAYESGRSRAQDILARLASDVETVSN
jgi:tetratricopeptide (TPR) repeat protein